MADNSYQFFTTWRIPGTCEEIMDVLSDGPGLARWWPSVYLDVAMLDKGDKDGLGSVVDLYTKGWLPYTLRWKFVVTERNYPNGFTLRSEGDFIGRGIWTFRQDGPTVEVTYDWKISAEKPLLKALTPVLRPVFEANHRWAMEKGEESLHLELARRHATSDLERMRIPPPPPPTTSSPMPILLGILVVLAVLGVVVVLAGREFSKPQRRHFQ